MSSESCNNSDIQPTTNHNCKSEGGNGPIPSSKESAPVPEEDIPPLSQVPPSSSSEDTTILAKTKDTPISTIPTFLTSMLINSQNPKFQEHLRQPDMLTQLSSQVQKSSSSEEEEPKVKYSEIYTHSIQSQWPGYKVQKV